MLVRSRENGNMYARMKIWKRCLLLRVLERLLLLSYVLSGRLGSGRRRSGEHPGPRDFRAERPREGERIAERRRGRQGSPRWQIPKRFLIRNWES